MEHPNHSVTNDAVWRVSEWWPDLEGQSHQRLATYHRELIKFNARLNLISRGTEAQADEIHFADCLGASSLLALDGRCDEVFDFGSGNGLPGLVLAILHPRLKLHLVESDSRKVEFLKHVAHLLNLSNVRCHCVRVQTLPKDSVAMVVSRGFASIDQTLAVSAPLIQPGGVVYHLKGAGYSDELAALGPAQRQTWSTEVVGTYALPVSRIERVVLVSRPH